MRFPSLLVACTSVALLVLACNGRIRREEGDCTTGTGAAFCDAPQSAPKDPIDPVRFPSGSSSPAPAACVLETLSFPGSDAVCPGETFRTQRPVGSTCGTASDCASVCCVIDETGHWRPADDASDAGTTADGDADAEDPAANPYRQAARRVYACECECLSPREACARLVLQPHGLGGP